MTPEESRARLDGLVRNYVDVVYASALRQMRDPHAAADVTQAVFLVLQRKLPEMDGKAEGRAMGAWLMRVTRYACLDAAKRLRRRMFHERKAAAMRAEEQPAGEDISPLIDEALDRLSRTDREVIVMAYLEGRTHEEIASCLGIGREAAHKRVQRAVERMRGVLRKRGVTAAALAAGLAGCGKAGAAPVAVSQAVMGALGGQAPALVLHISKGTMIMMKLMQMKAGLLWVVAAGALLAAVAFVPAWGQNGPASMATAPAAIRVAPAVGQEAGLNPLYLAWKGQEGQVVKFERSEQISGGAPVGGGNRPAATSTVQFALSEITADQAVVKVTVGDGAAEMWTIPAKVGANDPALPKTAGKEDLKIGSKTYSCTKYTYSTRSKAEMGRDGQGLPGQVTVWVADAEAGVPGGIVKRHISLTIRVTYDMTDTMVESPRAQTSTAPATGR